MRFDYTMLFKIIATGFYTRVRPADRSPFEISNSTSPTLYAGIFALVCYLALLFPAAFPFRLSLLVSM